MGKNVSCDMCGKYVISCMCGDKCGKKCNLWYVWKICIISCKCGNNVICEMCRKDVISRKGGDKREKKIVICVSMRNL